jgi:hypothetical protein
MLTCVLAALLFTSCVKKVDEPLTVKTYGKIQVYHAAVDAPAIDFIVDGKKVNTDSLAYPKGIPYYDAELLTGKKNTYKVVAAKNSQSVSVDSLTMTNADKGYSVFVYQDKDAAKTVRTLYVPDDLLAPPAGKAKVRLVQLISDFSVSMDAQFVAPKAAATAAIDYASLTFPKITDFIYLPKGTYDLKFKLSGQTTTPITFTDITVEEGKIYTLVARGLSNVATTATKNRGAALSIVTNK